MNLNTPWKLVYKQKVDRMIFLIIIFSIYGIYKLAPLSITLGLRIVNQFYPIEHGVVHYFNVDKISTIDPWYILLEMNLGAIVFIVAILMVMTICGWFIYYGIKETFWPAWLEGQITKIQDLDAEETSNPKLEITTNIMSKVLRTRTSHLAPLYFITIDSVRLGIPQEEFNKLQEKHKVVIGSNVKILYQPKLNLLLELYIPS